MMNFDSAVDSADPMTLMIHPTTTATTTMTPHAATGDGGALLLPMSIWSSSWDWAYPEEYRWEEEGQNRRALLHRSHSSCLPCRSLRDRQCENTRFVRSPGQFILGSKPRDYDSRFDVPSLLVLYGCAS